MNNFKESDLVFDEETHTYSLPGVGILPGPSVVLDAMGFVSDFAKNSPKAQRFGTHAHKMVELDVKGILDENSLSEGLMNSFRAWRKFRKNNPQLIPVLDRIEVASFHPLYLYAGTPDILMYEVVKNVMVYHLIDIKTGCYCHSYRLQTSAYEGILRYWLKVRVNAQFKRSILFLSDTSDEPKLVPLTDRTDWNAWLNVLGCYNWKKRNGYL